jgi:hypothetical protein
MTNLDQMHSSRDDADKKLILLRAVIAPSTEITIQNLQMGGKIPARIIRDPPSIRLPLMHHITVTKNQDQSDVGYIPVHKKMVANFENIFTGTCLLQGFSGKTLKPILVF